ncbi:hypothetical protein SAMN05421678_101391 [Actinopolymorpha cephalotaxi]|uniref:Secreted protein n=1 Tax=Actinopolymorpha cephalotaxi TaxID=504797 RepID=A0A1I2KLU2_9ACTN|nr:DUF5719 family protein [Actinopolymorpha cephalotaxi]NYH84534.1 hypothetical protein [Actinopolymorpha cephalotaxi]SFF67954.1 hypothetical protein SAMN05421678_101391 [Actinopolymorpha cephalotaxi]
MSNPFVRLGAVVVAAAVLVGGATLATPALTSADQPAQAAGRPTRVPLDRATLVCPESRYVRSESATDVTAVAAPGRIDAPGVSAAAARRAADTPGELAVLPLGSTTPLTSVDQRERLAAYEVRKKDTPPLLVSAQGAVAPGAAAGQLTRAGSGPLRGLAEAPCTRPGTQFWFVGTGSALGQHGRLYLTNSDEGSAQVDLRLYDEKGPVDADAARGLTVAPGKQTVVELDKLAPTSKRLAVAVVAQRGRVAAALRNDAQNADTAMGVDWIPSGTSPAKQVVVPGIAPGDGERVLSVVAPADSTASVNLSVLGPDGTFRPSGLGDLEVKPGTVAEIPLQEALRKQAGAVRVESDVPVTASVRSVFGSGSNPHDVAYSAASTPLSGPAVVPSTDTGEGRSASLLLSSPSQQAVNASVRLYSDDGRDVGSTKVTVRPGSTVETKLEPKEDVSRYTVVVTPDSGGPLYGSRLRVEDDPDGPMASSWTLTSAESTVVRPSARSDIGAGIGVRETVDPMFQ